MLRRLIALNQRLSSSTTVQAILGTGFISLGLVVLNRVANDRAEELQALDAAIEARLARLRELELAKPAEGPYPAAEDVDPLGRGTAAAATFNGFEPVDAAGTVAPGPVPQYEPE